MQLKTNPPSRALRRGRRLGRPRRCVVLLLPVFFHVCLTGFLGVVRRVMTMTTGSVRVMGGLFVLPALVIFSGFGVVSRCVCMVLCCVLWCSAAFLDMARSSGGFNKRRDTPLGPKFRSPDIAHFFA